MSNIDVLKCNIELPIDCPIHISTIVEMLWRTDKTKFIKIQYGGENDANPIITIYNDVNDILYDEDEGIIQKIIDDYDIIINYKTNLDNLVLTQSGDRHPAYWFTTIIYGKNIKKIVKKHVNKKRNEIDEDEIENKKREDLRMSNIKIYKVDKIELPVD